MAVLVQYSPELRTFLIFHWTLGFVMVPNKAPLVAMDVVVMTTTVRHDKIALMASLIRSIVGHSKCCYQGLWLAVLSADVIGQSK